MTFLRLFEEYLKRNEEGRVDLGSQWESTWQGKHGRCGPCLWQGWHVAWGVSHRAKEAEGLAGKGAELWASKSILLQPASSSWAPPLNGSTTSQQHQWTTSCSNPRACGRRTPFKPEQWPLFWLLWPSLLRSFFKISTLRFTFIVSATVLFAVTEFLIYCNLRN